MLSCLSVRRFVQVKSWNLKVGEAQPERVVEGTCEAPLIPIPIPSARLCGGA